MQCNREHYRNEVTQFRIYFSPPIPTLFLYRRENLSDYYSRGLPVAHVVYGKATVDATAILPFVYMYNYLFHAASVVNFTKNNSKNSELRILRSYIVLDELSIVYFQAENIKPFFSERMPKKTSKEQPPRAPPRTRTPYTPRPARATSLH